MSQKPSRTQYSPLCWCEYYDRDGERNHLAAACCNCQDLDEAFERCISCRQIPGRVWQGILSAVQDRLRLPWPGGAIEIPFQFIVPFLIVPTTIILSTLGPFATFFFFTTAGLSLWYYHSIHRARTLFWPGLILASVVTECIIFQTEVVPFMEILPVENCILIIMLSVGLTALALTHYHAKFASPIPVIRTAQNPPLPSTRPEPNGTPIYCSVCKEYVQFRRLHCIWLNCCITASNYVWLCTGTIMCALTCLYGADLSLTTICHPSVTYFGKWLLIPDNCEDVYGDFELAICFVSAVYNLILGILLVIVFFRLVYLQRRYQRTEKYMQTVDSLCI